MPSYYKFLYSVAIYEIYMEVTTSCYRNQHNYIMECHRAVLHPALMAVSMNGAIRQPSWCQSWGFSRDFCVEIWAKTQMEKLKCCWFFFTRWHTALCPRQLFRQFGKTLPKYTLDLFFCKIVSSSNPKYPGTCCKTPAFHVRMEIPSISYLDQRLGFRQKNVSSLKLTVRTWKGTISIGNTSSNHQFSGATLVSVQGE